MRSLRTSLELHLKKTSRAYLPSDQRTLALDGLKLGILLVLLASRPRFQQLVPDSVPCADQILGLVLGTPP